MVKAPGRVKGLSKLTEIQKILFENTYTRHMLAMGTEMREKFEGKIKEVKWDAKENCLKVYYKEGTWWHYDTRGCWY